MRISRRARFDNAETVAPHQFSVLAKLENTVRTPRQLADIECVSAPSMTRTVAGLVEKGLVCRTDDPDDRRQVQLSLTKEGLHVLKEGRRTRDEWMLSRIEGLSEQECEVLDQAREILGRVVAR
ncbi:MarR family transcriptional regulator [Leekyejoonella antrihumi]|uniref:MarR family transcriptional regulator n=2 Tax=Leekyejoonella antrihumi TaxID=1660198 RepID=A0A563DZ49_9MICO|nr:MarR family transcriptional regulator [Leekyejoonella antrihumi]